MPPGTVEQQDSVSAAPDAARDFTEMLLHCVGIDEGQRKSRSFAARRADGAKEIEVFITLIGGLTRPRSPPSPLTDLSVFLADARFVLEPNLDRFALWDMGQMRVQRAREVFLNASMISGFCPG